MAFTSTVAARPATLAVRASVRAARPQRVAAPKRALLARASGKEFLSSEGAKLQEALSAALKEAEECQDECAPAWDVVVRSFSCLPGSEGHAACFGFSVGSDCMRVSQL